MHAQLAGLHDQVEQVALGEGDARGTVLSCVPRADARPRYAVTVEVKGHALRATSDDALDAGDEVPVSLHGPCLRLA